MNHTFQSFLLKIYSWVIRTGVLSTSWGRWLFFSAYNSYKYFAEAREIRILQSSVKPDEVVIDIGANVGFFTRRFAKWVSGKGFVIALEPESFNFRQLQRGLEKSGVAGVVRTIQGVAAEKSGTLKLAVNPIHPGDHKIGSDGVDVPAFSVDDLIETESADRICLIKIDVQGAEEQVLRGATKTIERDHPAIFIEIYDKGLKEMGSSSERVVTWLMDLGYVPQRLGQNAQLESITLEKVLELSSDGRYVDLLFIKP